MAMDAVDRAVVDALRHDGRLSYAELARQLGISSSTAHERVAKLESSGVISGYRALVDPREIGAGVTAFIGIEPGENGRDEDIAAALEALSEVESCYWIAGEEAFIILVRVASVDDLHRCLGRVRAIDGVARTRTTVVLATRFESRPVAPIGEETPAASAAGIAVGVAVQDESRGPDVAAATLESRE